MTTKSALAGAIIIATTSAACAQVLGLEEPVNPDAQAPADAAGIDAGGGDASVRDAGAPDVSGTSGDGGAGEAAPPVCPSSCAVGAYVGTCSAGGCTPVAAGPMVPNQMVTGVAISGDSIFAAYQAAVSGIIAQIPIDGGHAVNYSITEDEPSGLVVDTKNLYWTDIGTFDEAGTSLSPGTGTIVYAPFGIEAPTTLTAGRNVPTWLTVDQTNVYWTDQGNDQGTPNGQVLTCPIANCGQPTVLASNQSVPKGIVVSAGKVYWVNQGMKGDGQIAMCDVHGCGMNPTIIDSNLVFPDEIVASGGVLYWTDGGSSYRRGTLVPDGKIYAWQTTGSISVPAVLAANQPQPWGIAVDGTDVYWTNYGRPGGSGDPGGQGGQVMRCAVGGCNQAPTILQSARGPTEIAVGPQFVVWGDVTGQVWVLAK